ncbi:uncharacterized protein G2W53_009367 [Senna tora]|uniref:Uncharacterized protein n=1 Tax=Senna tora TaxID=362788 RepID=A0A834WYU9_9FABA|nr:uncharacterized protein G2W53_009367 [Senna tora]
MPTESHRIILGQAKTYMQALDKNNCGTPSIDPEL